MEGIALKTPVPNQKIALRGVRLRSAVAALAERTVVEQTFVNQEDVAIEAVYTFPLPEDAAVCHFEVVTGDRVLTGVVEETEQAIEKYDAAIDRGDAAYLLEQERPDVFTIRVGNINPKQAATIRLTYVRPLKVVDRQVRLAFPTTVAPRYVTATGSNDPLEAAIDGDALNPPHALHVPYGLSIEIQLDLGPGVASVTSPSHAIDVKTGEGDRRRITFAGGTSEMNRDVVLDVRLAKEQRAGVVVVKGDLNRGGGNGNDHFLAVTFMPEFEVDHLARPDPAETVFVLDCSGSMQGPSMEQATAALELCLRSLGEADSFNICRFGSHFEMLSEQPLRYTAESLRDALAYVRNGRTDLGGTELYPPLQAILQTPPAVGRIRNIVLLTDGEVTNETEVIQLVRQHRARNRIFAFGIGAAASAHLVNGLARATGGASEFISDGERIEEKVLRAFGRMASPMVSGVEIDWGGADVQTLAEIPPLFDGDALAVYGRALGSPPKQVTLKCKMPGGDAKAWTLPVGYAIPDAGIVATMWARRAIQSFEEVNGVRRSSARLREQSRDRDRLIALSKQFNLVCSLTSFIAVEHRSLEERNAGQPAVRRVPVMLAKGWGGHGPDVLYSVARPSAMRRPMAARCMVPAPRLRPSASVGRVVADPGVVRDQDPPASGSRRMARRSVPPVDPLVGLVLKLLGEAIQAGASSLEFYPENDSLVAAITVGGARRVSDRVPSPSVRDGLPRLVKQYAGLNTKESDQPQAGLLTVEIDGKRATPPVHVTPLPGNGEGVSIDVSGCAAAVAAAADAPVVVLVDPPPDPVMRILASQTTDGIFLAWPDTGAIKMTGAVLHALNAFHNGRDVLQTVLCLLALQLLHKPRAAVWQRAHAKGCRHVADKLKMQPAEVVALLDRLEQELSPARQPVA